MTVSRALGGRGRGRIAEATRQRILTLSEKLGYRPDPEIAKLMHHLRGRRSRRFQSIIIGLTTRSADDREVYFRTLAEGASVQLADRGYRFELRHISATADGWSGFERVLKSRGVEGILVLPQHAPVDLSALLNWNDFSVISASASAGVPGAHRVTPHHFANALLLCRRLAERGHRRIGLVIDADHDRRTQHGFVSAVTWHGLNEAAHFVPPLVTTGPDPEPLRAWFVREQPDAIITQELSAARNYARELRHNLNGSVRFVVTSLSRTDTGGLAGIDELPEKIGSAAADLLASRVERGVRNQSESPVSTLLPGHWVE